MFKQKIEKELNRAVRDLGFVVPHDPLLSISEKTQFGDYSSNIPMQLSKQKHKKAYQSPVQIANAIIQNLGHPDFLERVEVAGPGFLNFFIKDEALIEQIVAFEERAGYRKSFTGEEKAGLMPFNDKRPASPRPPSREAGGEQTMNEKRIIVEYCDPNTHKMLHIGHLLPLTLGESLARLLEYRGHKVYRTNYGSDIGLTVAKCLWGVGKLQDEYQKAKASPLLAKADFLGKAYAYAHKEYEKSLEAKEEIDQITDKLYRRDLSIVPLWKETKEWSSGYFETIYSVFGTLYDRRVNESEVDKSGKELVFENVGKVFVKDDGAVIFPGEKYNLHNRVFINSKGNPTYEGKEVGLADKYQELFQFDELNIFSHKEQDDYFKVVIKVNEMIYPHLGGKIKHISFGEVRLPGGKMSSREGNIVAAEDILKEVKLKIREVSPQLDSLTVQKLAVSAIKFAFLKYSVSSDIVYDIEESVSIHGDTGPYVMYVYARIMSILKKVSKESKEPEESDVSQNHAQHSLIAEIIEPEEREVLRQLEYFELIIEKATTNFQPNEITKYLLNLAKAFNLFYEKMPVIGSKQETFRLMLCKNTAENIKLGLYLLGIETVEKM